MARPQNLGRRFPICGGTATLRAEATMPWHQPNEEGQMTDNRSRGAALSEETEKRSAEDSDAFVPRVLGHNVEKRVPTPGAYLFTKK